MTIPKDVKLQSAEFPIGTIKVDDIVLEIQIADTDPRRARGLMFQEIIPYNQGMLFVFEDSAVRSIWILNMQFAFDLICFVSSENVVHIEKNFLPCKSALETLTSNLQVA